MISISLTDFVDFVASSGTPKLTKVRYVKGRPEYHPALDFYRILRNALVAFHQEGSKDKSELDGIITNLTDEKKKKRYDTAIRGYKKFLGKKNYEWFTPPGKTWSPPDDKSIEIKVNPELGLIINGESNLIKIYFKAETLSKRRAETILVLMQDALSDHCPPGCKMGVLDIQRGKLHSVEHIDLSILPLLYGEADSFKTIWNNLS